MNDKNKIKKHEKAEKDYILGMSEKDIASKYDVKITTVRTWKYRYKWDEKNETTVSKKCIKINGFLCFHNSQLKERGHIVEWQNGEQSGFKKNESAELKLKISAERRKIITHLGLDSIIKVEDKEDEAL